jgi:Cys-tRNA(Pro)/Cys-tRNA(Cys) deacylase
MTKTNAVRRLERAGIDFSIREYRVDQNHLDAVAVARAIDAEPDRVFKTLVTRGDRGGHYVFCIPGNAELDLRKAARTSGVRSIALIPLKELHPLTGYVHGGCSPIEMKKAFPTWIDESCELFDTIFVSAGVRGMQIEIAPRELCSIVGANPADLIA